MIALCCILCPACLRESDKRQPPFQLHHIELFRAGAYATTASNSQSTATPRTEEDAAGAGGLGEDGARDEDGGGGGGGLDGDSEDSEEADSGQPQPRAGPVAPLQNRGPAAKDAATAAVGGGNAEGGEAKDARKQSPAPAQTDVDMDGSQEPRVGVQMAAQGESAGGVEKMQEDEPVARPGGVSAGATASAGDGAGAGEDMAQQAGCNTAAAVARGALDRFVVRQRAY